MNTQHALPSDEHLRLLSVFHYVWTGLGILGLGFLALHYGFMQELMDPEFLAKQDKPPPAEFIRMLGMFKWIYFAFGLYGVTTMVLNFLAARWLRARRNWTFCIVVSAINWPRPITMR